MALARRKWFGRVFTLAVVGALVAGGWYAYTQGWLVPVRDWVSQLQTKGGGEAASPGGHAGHGGMPMPGTGSATEEPMGTPP